MASNIVRLLIEALHNFTNAETPVKQLLYLNILTNSKEMLRKIYPWGFCLLKTDLSTQVRSVLVTINGVRIGNLIYWSLISRNFN
jgi:hypothetical protein